MKQAVSGHSSAAARECAGPTTLKDPCASRGLFRQFALACPVRGVVTQSTPQSLRVAHFLLLISPRSQIGQTAYNQTS